MEQWCVQECRAPSGRECQKREILHRLLPLPLVRLHHRRLCAAVPVQELHLWRVQETSARWCEENWQEIGPTKISGVGPTQTLAHIYMCVCVHRFLNLWFVCVVLEQCASEKFIERDFSYIIQWTYWVHQSTIFLVIN